MSTAGESSTTSIRILYLGLDVHKASIVIAVLPADAQEPTRVDRVPNEMKTLRRYFGRLAEQGERKHDRYDARQLARWYRSGDLTPVRIPTEAEERVRDLVRCRAIFQRELLRARHYVLKFLTRRGVRYTAGKCHWTRGHHTWLEQLPRSGVLQEHDATVFAEYLALVHFAQQRRDALDTEIEQLALLPTLKTAVAWLSCFRGIQAPAAVTLTTEIVDWRRFAKPTQLMTYVGLVPKRVEGSALSCGGRTAGFTRRHGGPLRARA